MPTMLVEKSSKLITDWQPHKDRNQIVMILEEMSDQQQDDYDKLMYDYWKDSLKYNPMISMQIICPSISCEHILKVLEG